MLLNLINLEDELMNKLQNYFLLETFKKFFLIVLGYPIQTEKKYFKFHS